MRSYFGAPDEPPEGGEGGPPGQGVGEGHDPLPYRVEVWDETGAYVEQVVALTANRSVGWAAYFATKEQFPSRCITFRDPYGELSRWGGKKH